MHARNKGFSLVELAIVLVILGLLVGGVLAGRSLIRAAELRSISTDMARYKTATMAFRDKYFALPGDITNATQFWGTAATCPTDYANPFTGQATCNGDGSGLINTSPSEIFYYWQHLANAGLIEGTYDGRSDHASSSAHHKVGTNCPATEMDAVGFEIRTGGNKNNDGLYFDGNHGTHHFLIGKRAGGGHLTNAFLRAEEAWNIDTKLDDGMPGSGKLRTGKNTARVHCATSNDPATAEYQYGSSEIGCQFFYLGGF